MPLDVNVWTLIVEILNLSFSLASIWRRPAAVQPFGLEVLRTDELLDRLPSPLSGLPPYVPRADIQVKEGNVFFVGPPGVGKTREAFEHLKRIERVLGVEWVYFASGYIDLPMSLPPGSPVRRVCVFIDDYDYGPMAQGSSDYYERAAGASSAIANLCRTVSFFEKRTELCGVVVTASHTRLPLTTEHESVLAETFHIVPVPALDKQTYSDFLDALCEFLSLRVSSEVRDRIVALCDGRFDTLALFLSGLARERQASIEEKHVDGFRRHLGNTWQFFRQKLTRQQRDVYDAIRLIRKFGLSARVTYISRLLQDSTTGGYSEDRIQNLCRGLWEVKDGKAITYDGQFPDDQPSEAELDAICEMVLASGVRLRKADRYTFLKEAKSFLSITNRWRHHRFRIQLLQRLAKWYRRDKLLRYWHALSYFEQRRYFRAMSVLWGALRDWDPMLFFSGKWILIHLHLLLSEVYLNWGLFPSQDLHDAHEYIEREFKLAASLADLAMPDVGAEGFKVVFLNDRDGRDPKKDLKRYLLELGIDTPIHSEQEWRKLRGMVHHRYSQFLLRQTSRELDALEQEMLALEATPDLGEALIDCAGICERIGDSRRALHFLERAERAKPAYLTQAQYKCMIYLHRARNYLDVRDEDKALHWYGEAKRACGGGDGKMDLLARRLEENAPSCSSWARSLRLAGLRSKEFETGGIVFVERISGMRFRLSPDWKIAGEFCSEEDPPHYFTALFGSQIKWDEDSKSPWNASIFLEFCRVPEKMAAGPQSHARELIQTFESQEKFSWRPIHCRLLPKGLQATSYSFDQSHAAAKCGELHVLRTSTVMLSIHVMCLRSSAHIFLPILTQFLDEAYANFDSWVPVAKANPSSEDKVYSHASVIRN